MSVTCALIMSGRCVLLLGNYPNANHLGEAQLIAVCLVTVWKCLLSWQHLGVWLESEGEHGE